MIDQIKIGSLLRNLRKEKELTQEELAEKFGVSSRSVSRWENGKTMPELGILVKLADYYEVDIREIIDGERKSEIMENGEKETLRKVADYAEEEKKIAVKRKCIKYSVSAAIIIFFVLMVGIIGSVYTAQWNLKGVSKNIGLTIDYNEGLYKIKEKDGITVYTYHLTDCTVGLFLNKKIMPLEKAIFDKLSLNDMTGNLQKKKVDNTDFYEAENYKICLFDSSVVITDIETKLSEIYDIMRKK